MSYDNGSRYHGVVVYAIVEARSYFNVERIGRGYHGRWRLNGIAQNDEIPDIKGWNVYGADGKIDYPFLDIEQFPTLGAVEKFIDFKLKEIKYHGQ